MFFFFGPLFFLFPILFVLIAARLLSRFFRQVFRDGHELPRAEGTSIGSSRVPARLESRVFSLAYRLGGRLTVSDVIIDTGLGAKETEELLERMTDEVRVRMIVDDRGLVVYEFPEIIDRLERETK